MTHACRDGADFFGLFARAEIAPEAAHNIWAFNKHKEAEDEDQDGACNNIANGTKGSSEVVAEFANEVGREIVNSGADLRVQIRNADMLADIV